MPLRKHQPGGFLPFFVTFKGYKERSGIMALLTHTEFAKHCGVSSASISMAKRNKKVVYKKAGKMDTEAAQNKIYFNGCQSRAMKKKLSGVTPPVVSEKKTRDSSGRHQETPEEVNDVLYGKLKAERQVKEKQVRRLDAASEIMEFKALRLKGEYLPTQMVKRLFSTHFQSTTKSFQHTLEALLTDISVKYKINRNDQAEFRKKIIEEINIGAERGMIDTENQLAQIVENVMSQKYA